MEAVNPTASKTYVTWVHTWRASVDKHVIWLNYQNLSCLNVGKIMALFNSLQQII
jgi:hypothetical protein